MLFKNIAILDENYEMQRDMNVRVTGDTITYIGKVGDDGKEDSADKVAGTGETRGNEIRGSEAGGHEEIYDGRGKLLMSGFFNCHGHSPMSLMRGYGENMKLQSWLNDKIFPFEAQLDGDAVYWGTLLAMAESIRFGIVSTSDMYYFVDDMVRAVGDSGAKNNISRSITNFTGGDFWDLPSAGEAKEAYEKYNNAFDGRVKIEMSLHAEYTSNPETAKALADYTRETGAGMHVHVSETKQEHEECKERHGMTPVAYLDSCGIFDTRSVAAHCVWIESEDFAILKDRGVSVAVNPVSNMKLSSGIADVQAMLDKGINAVIGTDSVASNNSLNFIEEMKLFTIGPKVALGDPTAVSPIDAVKAATERGALAQGREDSGKVAPGYKADLIVLDISGPHMCPVHNMLNNIVYSASGSDVLLTMVNGKVLYRDGEFTAIDMEKTMFEVEKAKNRILGKL